MGHIGEHPNKDHLVWSFVGCPPGCQGIDLSMVVMLVKLPTCCSLDYGLSPVVSEAVVCWYVS